MRQPVPFGKYLLLDRISVGGMAEVFKAKSYGVEGFEKVIAIKRILPSMCEDQDFIKMFIDEAKIAGQLSHANICQIFELGRVKNAHFIAMEYIWGRDLLQIQNRCRQRTMRMPIEMACYVIAQVCEGLDYAHQKKDALGRPLKIIHRDCSPQNVLISYEGEVKVIDFGIAKAASRSSRTNAGVLKGKFGYMSPEQVRGLPLDRRSDIFALGTVLYESLTGERLFLGESDFSTLERVRNADVKPPSTLNGDIPTEVEAVVMKALSRDPDDRYQWCGELRADLQRFLTSRDKAFTAKSLAGWMRNVFTNELEAELKLMEQYKKVGRDGLIDGLPHAEADLDVVSELGEAGDPEGDPTVLGGPSIEEMLAEAERRFSARGRKSSGGVDGFGDDAATGIAGEVDSDAVPPPNLEDLDAKKTIALDDAELGQLAEIRKGPPAMPADGPPPGATPPPGSLGYRGPQGPFGYPSTGQGAGLVPVSSGAYPRADWAMTTDSVSPMNTGGFPLPSAGHLRRKSSLLRDVAIGVLIAGAVLGIFIAGKMFLADGDKKAKAGKAALAVLAADGQPAEVFLNGASVGRFADGQALTIEGLAAGEYIIELRRAGSPPCVETATLTDKVKVVSCRFEGPEPETGTLNLRGVTEKHRIFINDTEISYQAALEPIQLEPAKENLVYVRVGDTRIQEFRITIQAGEEAVREVEPVPPNLASVNPKKPEKDPGKERDRNRDRPRDRPVSPKDRPIRPKLDSGKSGEKRKAEMGYFTAKTRPWARVLIDGRDTGKMTPIPPRVKIPLKPGSHKVTFVVDGQRFSYGINIKAGEVTHLSKNLGN